MSYTFEKGKDGKMKLVKTKKKPFVKDTPEQMAMKAMDQQMSKMGGKKMMPEEKGETKKDKEKGKGE